MTRAVLVPSTLVLLAEYRGLVDPVPDLRAACRDAVGSLVTGAPPLVRVVAAPARSDNIGRGVASPVGQRVARQLLHEVGWSGRLADGGTESAAAVPLLVVGNGSACRGERAPGHLDPRAEAFDAVLGAALVTGDPSALAALDPALGETVWCHDVPAFHRLARVLPPGPPAEVRYDADPFGVQYWVLTWP